MAICPACGGWITRVETSASGVGEIRYSGCCLIGLKLLDNWKCIEGLSESRREKAIARSRAKFDRWQERNLAEYEAGASMRERARQILRDADRELDEDEDRFEQLYGGREKEVL